MGGGEGGDGGNEASQGGETDFRVDFVWLLPKDDPKHLPQAAEGFWGRHWVAMRQNCPQ